jgi:hypothetical protein
MEEYSDYSSTNTIMLDYTADRLSSHQNNSINNGEFNHLDFQNDAHHYDDQLLQAISYLKKLNSTDNIKAYMKNNPFISKKTVEPTEGGRDINLYRKGRFLSNDRYVQTIPLDIDQAEIKNLQ